MDNITTVMSDLVRDPSMIPYDEIVRNTCDMFSEGVMISISAIFVIYVFRTELLPRIRSRCRPTFTLRGHTVDILDRVYDVTDLLIWAFCCYSLYLTTYQYAATWHFWTILVVCLCILLVPKLIRRTPQPDEGDE